MIFERDESDTDYICRKGESLQKVAVELPEKWYIPLEHYVRVTENLCLELRQLRDNRQAMHDARDRWRFLTIALLVICFYLAILIR